MQRNAYFDVWVFPVGVQILIQIHYLYKTLLMRSCEELVKLLNIKVTENSVYKSILKREKKNKLKGFHSGMK